MQRKSDIMKYSIKVGGIQLVYGIVYLWLLNLDKRLFDHQVAHSFVGR
jgi:hypothetical protein